MSKFETRLRAGIENAVRVYWRTRSKQDAKQGKATGSRDSGNRAAVTAGKQLDGFIQVVRTLVVECGVRPHRRNRGDHQRRVLLPDSRYFPAALRQRHIAHRGYRPDGHGRGAVAAENPVEVRGDLHHRVAGVLRVADHWHDHLRHYLWAHIASVMFR